MRRAGRRRPPSVLDGTDSSGPCGAGTTGVWLSRVNALADRRLRPRRRHCQAVPCAARWVPAVGSVCLPGRTMTLARRNRAGTGSASASRRPPAARGDECSPAIRPTIPRAAPLQKQQTLMQIVPNKPIGGRPPRRSAALQSAACRHREVHRLRVLTQVCDFPRLTPWRCSQVAKAADCKSAIAGSNPASAFRRIPRKNSGSLGVFSAVLGCWARAAWGAATGGEMHRWSSLVLHCSTPGQSDSGPPLSGR
jgi:hypothetical protein